MPSDPLAVQLRHAGRERPYLLHLPSSPHAGSLPLVVQLHGRGIDARSFDRWTGFSALAEERGFALAMPSAVNERWNDGRLSQGRPEAAIDDVGYLVAVIDDAIARFPIDRRRIHVAGMSNGAAMAGRLACERPERIAAVAQVAGTAAAAIASMSRSREPLPILQMHGTGDAFAPYTGGSAHGLRARLYIRDPAGPSIGVDDWARLWVEADGARERPAVEAHGPDVIVRRWTGPSPASEVAFYRIEKGGHTWPGQRTWSPPFLGRCSRTIDATSVIWEFFARHARAD